MRDKRINEATHAGGKPGERADRDFARGGSRRGLGKRQEDAERAPSARPCSICLAARKEAPAQTDFRLYWDAITAALTGRDKILMDTDKVPGRRNLWLMPLESLRLPPPRATRDAAEEP